MRFLAALIIAFAVFTSTNARFDYHYELSPVFQQCSGIIANATKDITMLREELNGITTNHKPYSEKLSKIFQDLKSFHSNVSYCCENFVRYRTRADNRAIPAFMSPMINEFITLIQVLISKKHTISDDTGNYANSADYVQYMYGKIRALSQCLVPEEKVLSFKIINAFKRFASYFADTGGSFGSFLS